MRHAFLVCSLLLIPFALHAQLRFSEQAVSAGVADTGEANGAAFGDYSGDGLPDLFVARLNGADPLLYRNRGDGTFADERAQLAGLGSTMGGVFVDYDLDGDRDLYAVRFRAPDQLLDNAAGRLAMVERAAPTGDHPFSMSAALADYDRDGRVDLFTAGRFRSPNQFYTRLHQDGFADLTELQSELRSGYEVFGALPFDYDGDGDADLYLSSLGFANLLFRNEGRGTFRQVVHASGLADLGSAVASLPADYDNDGDFDLYLVRARGETNSLYANEGGRFVEVAAGVAGTASSTSAAWADFDNDGDLDLLVSNIGATALYQNEGDGTFAEVSAQALPAATQSSELATAGIAVADYDADGDVDAFVAGLGTADLLLRNDSAPVRWLRVELAGRAGLTALGSKVRVRTAAGAQLREYGASTQVGTAHGGLLHFGLGAATAAAVEVEWASGQRQALTGVVADQVLALREPVPARDLRIEAVREPGLAPEWRARRFAVEVANAGTQAVAGARLSGQVVAGERVRYEQDVAVPALEAGERVRLRLPEWAPAAGGDHRFEFALTGDDEASGNSWARTHALHHLVDVAPELGVADAGAGFAGAWTDFDRDGDLDLYVSNGGALGEGVNALYRNDGAGFAEVGGESGVADGGNGTGVVFADFDRDGWEDLYICKGGFTFSGEANRLFRNRGDGTFADMTDAAGLAGAQSSYAAVAGDYDQDGYTDLYVSNLRGQPNLLYHNDRRGGFEEVGRARGILSHFNYSGGAGSFGDYDQDGDVDLYASMFGTFDLFYAETGGESFGVAEVGDEGDAVGMASGDYDNDGDLDIYIVNQSWRSALFRNDVEATSFIDVGDESGTENLARGAGCAFGDYDSDGDLDLFVVNAGAADRLYANRGDGTFSDLAVAHGMADTAQAWAVIMGDYDGDGDLDPYVVNEGAANRLYENRSAGAHWLQVGVRGVESNPEGLGARARVHADGRVWMQEVNGTAGLSQSSRLLHFGLGAATAVDSLVVHWPSGRADRFVDVPVGSRLAVVEGAALTAVAAAPAGGPADFALEANYPNPFNAETRIAYAVAARGRVRLAIFNALGQQVRTLVAAERAAGRHEVAWDGRDDRGAAVGSGVYFYRLESGGLVLARSLVLLR